MKPLNNQLLEALLLTIIYIIILLAGSCELPEEPVPPPPPPEAEIPLISDLYEKYQYHYATDRNYITTTAKISPGNVDSIRISYDCSGQVIRRRTTATYVFWYQVLVDCKEDLVVTYDFYSEYGDTTIVSEIPSHVLNPSDEL